MVGGSSNVSLLQQEIENLREQLKDLTEKYETLKGKINLINHLFTEVTEKVLKKNNVLSVNLEF